MLSKDVYMYVRSKHVIFTVLAIVLQHFTWQHLNESIIDGSQRKADKQYTVPDLQMLNVANVVFIPFFLFLLFSNALLWVQSL